MILFCCTALWRCMPLGACQVFSISATSKWQCSQWFLMILGDVRNESHPSKTTSKTVKYTQKSQAERLIQAVSLRGNPGGVLARFARSHKRYISATANLGFAVVLSYLKEERRVREERGRTHNPPGGGPPPLLRVRAPGDLLSR